MVKIIFKLLVLFCFTASLSPVALALTKVTASVDSNPVVSNDSIILTVIADDSVDRDALDTSVLLTDFIVARTEMSSQTSMVNFNTTRTTQWQIVLIPKSTGNLTIPPLTIDGYSSQAINIQVIEQSNSDATQQKDIFISTELSSTEIYVQQLVTLTVKLHVGVQLQRGSLTEPTLQGATIEQVNKDLESDGIINGKRYRIIERTYAITPEQSGELTLETPMFSGDIMAQSTRRSGFLSFGETKPVNIRGDKISLNVRPIPDSFPIDANNSWLPSELLSLHQEWQPNINEFIVGEPITRTITLTAAGLGQSQLPQITIGSPANLKVYPDQAELNSNLTKERLISQKRQNFALVASQPGEYTLPEISIAWWNTVTNRYQKALLPEQKITIKANPDAPAPLTNNTESTLLTQPQQGANTQQQPVQPAIINKTSNLQWLFLGLWLLTCIAWALHIIYLKRSSKNKAEIKTHTEQTVNNHYLMLMAACKKNNAEQALRLTLPWLKHLLLTQGNSEISTLSEGIIQLDNESFSSAINEVQQHLYGKEPTDNTWSGEKLLQIIQKLNTSKIKNSNKHKFTLNPS